MPISDSRKHNAAYGHRHRQVRKRLAVIVESGKAICWRCLKPIAPGSSWDVGHDGVDAYGRPVHAKGPTGPTEHSRCNRRDGGRNGGYVTAAKYFGKPAPGLKPGDLPGTQYSTCDTSRDW